MKKFLKQKFLKLKVKILDRKCKFSKRKMLKILKQCDFRNPPHTPGVIRIWPSRPDCPSGKVDILYILRKRGEKL